MKRKASGLRNGLESYTWAQTSLLELILRQEVMKSALTRTERLSCALTPLPVSTGKGREWKGKAEYGEVGHGGREEVAR